MMDQASAVQMNIVGNVSEQVLLEHYFLQDCYARGEFVNNARPSNQKAYWGQRS